MQSTTNVYSFIPLLVSPSYRLPNSVSFFLLLGYMVFSFVFPLGLFATHLQMLASRTNDIDNGLRFRNVNCSCEKRVNVRISESKNENKYKLYYCCLMDVCCYFEWCMALKVLLMYVEDIQQLQIELCVLKEELKAMHDKVQPIVETNIMVKIMFVGWCILIMTSM